MGGLIDTWGSRRLALPSIVLTGASLSLVGTAIGSLGQWVLLWSIYGLVSLEVKNTVWTTAVSGVFNAGRGLALGVALTGTAFAQMAIPPFARWAIDEFGWRQAYLWLGIGAATPCLILSTLFLFDAKDIASGRRASAIAAGVPADLGGLTLTQALRSKPLQRIALCTLLTIFIGTAILIHQVPILTASGVPRQDAAWLASLAGGAGILGKLATGWMVDRWNAIIVGMISLIMPAAGYWVLFDADRSLVATVLAMAVIGYTMGAKIQISAFLTARYAGMRNFGKIFGLMNSVVAIGGGLGSVAAGAVFDLFGNYDALLVFGIIGSVVCGALLYGLGPHPDWRLRSEVGPVGPALGATRGAA